MFLRSSSRLFSRLSSSYDCLLSNHLVSASAALHRSTWCGRYNFSYENHGEKLQSENISRVFGRFRYDEFSSFKTNPFKLSALRKQEQRIFAATFQQFEKREFKRFFDVASRRKDKRFAELPERYDNYNYHSMLATMGNSNDYLTVYRQEILPQSTTTPKGKLAEAVKVIDLMEIPIVRREYQNTANLTKMSFSDDHRFIAVGVDLRNDEHQTFFVKDVKNNLFLHDKLENVFNVKFSSCGGYLYYVKQDDKLWSHAIYKHKLGSESSFDELIFQERDPAFYLDITQSKDKKFLLINCGSKATNEIHAVSRATETEVKGGSSGGGGGAIKCLINRKDDCRVFCNHADGRFFVLTNKDLKTKVKCYDFKVMTIADSPSNSSPSSIQSFYEPAEGEIIQEIDLFSNALVLYILREGSTYMKVINTKNTSDVHTIELGDMYKAGTHIAPGLNENLDAETVRFHVNTPFVYNQIFDYHFDTKKCELKQDFELEGPRFNAGKYQSEIVYANAKDGELIPITLLRSKTLKKNRQNKVLLHGYGSYGVSMDIGFSVNYLTALEEGWTLAFSHVRGGGERGQKWHDAAVKEKKVTAITDFISCAEFLIAEGYTHPSLMCAYGASAGGLLVGAAINMRPELFKACVMNYPFLDVLTSLLDKEQALSASDYDEFGNPVEKEFFYDLIASYSPYENLLADVEYPAVYITCGSNDHRAPLWNVLKYVHRFRERAAKPTRVKEICPKNILVNVLDAGHQGEQGALQGIKERASYLAFLEYVVTKCNKDITIHKEDEREEEGEDQK